MGRHIGNRHRTCGQAIAENSVKNFIENRHLTAIIQNRKSRQDFASDRFAHLQTIVELRTQPAVERLQNSCRLIHFVFDSLPPSSRPSSLRKKRVQGERAFTSNSKRKSR